VATFCQYEALKYVSFPVQTLGKCAKMIPVMLWGAAVNGKTYKWKDYIIAFLVTTGCALFALTGMLRRLPRHVCARAGCIKCYGH
jgi:adenosine 3'-phospho 5'-phosphosulfate transporter B2